jgi:hypothetical protein
MDMDERKWELMKRHSKEIIDNGLVQFNIMHPEFRFGTPTNSEISEYTHRIYEFMRVDRLLHEQRSQSVPIEHKLLASTSIQWVKILLGSILWFGINTPLVKNWLISEFQQHYRQLLIKENHPYASLTPSEFASKMLTWLRDYRLGIR